MQIGGDEQLQKFGAGGTTNVTPLSVIFLVVSCALILALPRRAALGVFLFTALVMPFSTAVVVGTIHFQLIRFLIMPGLIRAFMESSKERPFFGKFHPIDKAFFALQIISAIAFVALNPEQGAVINQIGAQYTALGVYMVLRFFIRDTEDATTAIKTMVIVCCVAAAGMVVEHLTGGHNFFYLLGSISPEDGFREGRLRAQAFFAISIIGGCYAAAMFPLGFWFWGKGLAYRFWTILCLISSAFVVLASASSTPLLAFVAGIGAFAFWPLRAQMRWVRRGIVFTLVSLHMVMKAPVWQLIARIDIVGGNSADHRYQLINQCIMHFWEWWLIGTNDNYKWGWDMWDTANYYVGTAEAAGLFGFIALVAIISRSYRSIGLARAAFESDKRRQFIFWCVGCSLFSHCISFIGISYFDQTFVAWYALLAIIMALTYEWSNSDAIARKKLEAKAQANQPSPVSARAPGLPSTRPARQPSQPVYPKPR
ncbi:MAG TPA: hypothetical protein VMT51_10075 [Dongiaceae bacterium]|nr:hypothetical protein [Dongiaceae bacterium]